MEHFTNPFDLIASVDGEGTRNEVMDLIASKIDETKDMDRFVNTKPRQTDLSAQLDRFFA
ncbi:hypothetical protein SEA_FORZA_18 [Gordonia phage Forza]|uniref:Uncharacterized protein n=1 Tax=Gordonia phage Forza TaxID=2571247 RepID=A0A650F0G2_9CAUD|nr:hypothetical protein PP303_gp018 [Gordonia phage Forza]QEM41487.1 hypothetical protein SEA_BOOPY_18 [Gordonia phage Boopy]QGT55011.1 hypothetical protein SEA_FORZA_18 [Gordonia phage Forza]UXE04160.1 hypothetical protein SEA_BLUENGOLD_16 [Gordonia phage BlueNGold]WBF03799.1 hypothetical protein SEA_MAREELIH_16 [Gordonia phage Mareelih]